MCAVYKCVMFDSFERLSHYFSLPVPVAVAVASDSVCAYGWAVAVWSHSLTDPVY